MNDHRSKPRISQSLTPLSALLKEARHDAGLTQHQMAQLVGVSLKALREIEQGREAGVTIGTAQKIAAYFGKTISLVETVSVKDTADGILSQEDILKRLRSIKAALREFFGVSGLKLFGSYARGEASEASDVDLVIQSERKYSIKELTKMEIIASQVLDGKKVDLVIESEMLPDIRSEAERDMINV